jgi:gas vesicle protein
MAENNNALGFFVVGLGIGVVAGLMLAPQSGEETRKLIRSKADEGKDYLKGKSEEGREYVKRRGAELRDSASEILDRSKETLTRQKEQISMAVEAGKQAYRESVNEGPSVG